PTLPPATPAGSPRRAPSPVALSLARQLLPETRSAPASRRCPWPPPATSPRFRDDRYETSRARLPDDLLHQRIRIALVLSNLRHPPPHLLPSPTPQLPPGPLDQRLPPHFNEPLAPVLNVARQRETFFPQIILVVADCRRQLAHAVAFAGYGLHDGRRPAVFAR